MIIIVSGPSIYTVYIYVYDRPNMPIVIVRHLSKVRARGVLEGKNCQGDWLDPIYVPTTGYLGSNELSVVIRTFDVVAVGDR